MCFHKQGSPMSPAPRIKMHAVSSPQCLPARGTIVLPFHSTSSSSFLDVKYPPPWWPIFITRTPCLPLAQRSPRSPCSPPTRSEHCLLCTSEKGQTSFEKEADCLISQESFILFPCLARGGKKTQEGGWWPQAANTPPKPGARETSSGASCSSQASPLTPPPPPSQPPSGTFRGFPESCRTRRRFLDLSLASDLPHSDWNRKLGLVWAVTSPPGFGCRPDTGTSKPGLVWPEGMDAAASSVWHPGELGWLSLAETHSGWEGGLSPGSQSPGAGGGLMGWRGLISRRCCWSEAMIWLLGCRERTPEESECARCCPLHGRFCLHHLPHSPCAGLWPLRTTSAGRLWAPQLPLNPSGRSEDGETELSPSKSTKRDTS